MTGMTETGQRDGSTPAPPARGLINPALLEQLRKTVVSVTEPWWRGERIGRNGLIYGANIAGSRPPLFWCFQGYEEFANFAAALGPDQPLYGMRSGHLVVATSAEIHLHLAINYAEDLQSLGLPGPLFLGGNCQGALLAQKIAQILTAAGRPVSLLIGLNPFIFSPYSGRTALIVGQYDCTNPFLRFHDAEAVARANLPHCSMDILPSEHGRIFSGRILDLLSDVVRRRMDEAMGTFPGSFPAWSLNADIAAPAAMTMAPGSLCDVPVTLRNTSDMPWAPTGESGLWLGNHWRHADGSVLHWLDGRQRLEHVLRPGEVADLVLLVRAPAREGDYLLEVDIEHAGVMWLSEIGVRPAICRARVQVEARTAG